MEIHSVLAPTDFSDSASRGLDAAASLAFATGARLHLLHVLPERSMIEWTVLKRLLGDDHGSLRKHENEVAKEHLQLEAERVGFPDAELEVRSGAAAEEIAIASGSASIVVLATRGHTGIARIFLGSTAMRLLHSCPCPLMTIAPNATVNWDKHRGVLFPTDLSESSLAALETAIDLADSLSSDLELLHVVEDALLMGHNAEDVLGHDAPEFLLRMRQRVREILDTQVLPRLPDDKPVHTRIRQGEAVEQILREVEEQNIGLICMATQGHSSISGRLVGSYTERVAEASPVPVVSLRA